jgi:magnesium transporter
LSGHDGPVIRSMGYFRDGVPVALEGFTDATFDSPSVREAHEVIERAHERARADGGGAFVWVGLFQPTKAELASVASVFGLERHDVEDAGNSHQRPKADITESSAFLLMKVLSYVPLTRQVEAGQLAVFVGASYVLTVRYGSTRDLRQVRDRVAVRTDVLRKGPVGVLHAIVDQVVDGYLAVEDQVLAEVERLEEQVFSPRDLDLSESIYLLKRENLEVRRAVTPLLSLADDMVHERLDEVPAPMQAAFRDVGEHLMRVADHSESVDALLLALMAAANAKSGLRQNSDQRRIAAWAALALIPTVVGSIYGMNFVGMPELEWRWGYPVVLLLIGTLMTVVHRRLRRAGWL